MIQARLGRSGEHHCGFPFHGNSSIEQCAQIEAMSIGDRLAPVFRRSAADARISPASSETVAMRLRVLRRTFLAGCAAIFLRPSEVIAASEFRLNLASDDGSAVRNFRLGADHDPARLPGVLTVGPPDGDAIIYELFDYACGFCRAAADGLGLLLAHDTRLKLALVQNPILSPRSEAVARIVVAALRIAGPEVAYRLHCRIFQIPGPLDIERVLQAAVETGLDRSALARQAETGDDIARSVDRQREWARDANLRVTPAFVLVGSAFIGWPGPDSLAAMIDSARKCGDLRCD